jgi:hypothetical protein
MEKPLIFGDDRWISEHFGVKLITPREEETHH